MNTNLKIGLAFVAGGLLFNATFAISNSTSTEEVLSRAIAGAMKQTANYQLQREQEELEKLPNIMDCQNMQWMKNCKEINNQAKKNPNAPIRVTNQAGLEFNFVPGTPSPMIRLQLEQTPEAAKAAVQYMDQTWGEYKRSAGLYKEAMWNAGELDNIIGLDKAKAIFDAPKAINSKQISLSVFVHSMCGACEVQLSTLSKLQDRYPELKITVFQVDNNPAGFKAKVVDQGLKGRILTQSEANGALKAGVDKWPTTWVDNLALKQREKLSGVRSIVQIEESLQAATHIIAAKK